jgi:hypothetical protein
MVPEASADRNLDPTRIARFSLLLRRDGVGNVVRP